MKLSEVKIIETAWISDRIKEIDSILNSVTVDDRKLLKIEKATLLRVLYKTYSIEPLIRQTIEFGKDITREMSYINDNHGSPSVEFEDSTKEEDDFLNADFKIES